MKNEQKKGLYNTPVKVQGSLQEWEQESEAEDDCDEVVFYRHISGVAHELTVVVTVYTRSVQAQPNQNASVESSDLKSHL